MSQTHIYCIARLNSPVCKIGMTANVRSRLLALQTGSAEELKVVYASSGFSRTTASVIERTAHYFLNDFRLNGEWFSVGHDAAKMAIESVVDIVTGDHHEEDFPGILSQTKHQLEAEILSYEH